MRECRAQAQRSAARAVWPAALRIPLSCPCRWPACTSRSPARRGVRGTQRNPVNRCNSARRAERAHQVHAAHRHQRAGDGHRGDHVIAAGGVVGARQRSARTRALGFLTRAEPGLWRGARAEPGLWRSQRRAAASPRRERRTAGSTRAVRRRRQRRRRSAAPREQAHGQTRRGTRLPLRCTCFVPVRLWYSCCVALILASVMVTGRALQVR